MAHKSQTESLELFEFPETWEKFICIFSVGRQSIMVSRKGIEHGLSQNICCGTICKTATKPQTR